MLPDVKTVQSASSVYRVAFGSDPFRPKPWSVVRRTVPDILPKHDPYSLGGRFDDPTTFKRRPLPELRRFRTLYFASEPAGAFVEALQDFSNTKRLLRPPMLEDIIATEPTLAGLVDPGDPTRHVVPWEWFERRSLGSTRLDPALRFVDVRDAVTINHLGPVLAPLLVTYGKAKMGYSIIVGQERELTQSIASYFYEYLDDTLDAGPYAGIRYLSDLNQEYACWAVFERDLRHDADHVQPLDQRLAPVWLQTPGLWEAAYVHHLTLQGPDHRLYRPGPSAGTFTVV